MIGLTRTGLDKDARSRRSGVVVADAAQFKCVRLLRLPGMMLYKSEAEKPVEAHQ